jgi:hypothetical protein
MFKTELTKIRVNSFGHLDLENLKIVSDFDIRISDLPESNPRQTVMLTFYLIPLISW